MNLKLKKQPLKDSIKLSTPYLLIVAARLQTAVYFDRIAFSKVHPAESFILHELWKESPLSQLELSERLDIGSATVGQTVKRLERAGFIKRQRSPEDNRLVLVFLTEKGRATEAQIEKAARSLIQEVDSVLGAAEAKRFHASLHRLVTHFRTAQISTRISD